jgi:hypothetical protein
MKKFLHLHPNLIIAAIYVLFIGVLLAFYFWAVNNVFSELRIALITPPPQSGEGFNLAGAAKIDLHGLINGPSSTIIVPTSTVAGVNSTSISTTTAR